jgi:dipeptidyl aminopeptidase/acylaminoacyl peptidase
MCRFARSIFRPLILTAGCAFAALCLAQAAPGQGDDAPFSGPVVAFETALQDRVVLYEPATGALRTLRFDRRSHRMWGFSPDGCRLLLTLSDGDAPGRLYSARLDGTDLRELVTLEAGYGAWEPQWSPNPADPRIAFTVIAPADDGDGVPEHRIAWIPGGGGAAAYYSVAGDEHSARWSPDGAWLVYASYETSDADPPSREADLWIVSADGATKFQLTNFPAGSVSSPRWSPDGDLIGFVYSPYPNGDQFWMVGNAPDAIPTQLSYQPIQSIGLTWLPDSTAMIAAARDLQGIASNRLWRIPLIGNADADATVFFDAPDFIYPYQPAFSSDGRWLASRAAYALAILDLSTGQLFTIPDSYANTVPVWSPGGFAGESACEASGL